MKINDLLAAVINITWQTKRGMDSPSEKQRRRERAAIRQLFKILSLPTPDDETCDLCYPW